MINRRYFLGTAAAVTAGGAKLAGQTTTTSDPVRPSVISTWRHGLAANTAAWKTLSSAGRALDAVEAGVRQCESDPSVSSVGYGGLPDREGHVTLDACIMDEQGDCGSVAFLQHIENPISVARLVMQQSPHVMLVGEGALNFALANGLQKKDLLTDKAKQEWKKWQAKHPEAVQEREINVENHDTIGLLAQDDQGNLAGACTTSGLAWKLHGRVGDSPIIGAGLYVDNEIGAASATGVGEAVIRAVGSFLVVELMRQGHSPGDACRLATERVIAKNPDWKKIQVGFIALNKQGQVGGYSIQAGFDYAVYDRAHGNRLEKAQSRLPA
ncbi:MAG: N(4)-(beta-N-acetylglucosaminyl)-L-asparaginase [Bythopirellula sp.]